MNKADVRAIRKQLGLSQREFGDALGYSEWHIARIESGARNVADHFEKHLGLYVDNALYKQALTRSWRIISEAIERFGRVE